MNYTLDTTILGPVDVTASQIVAMVLNAPRQANWPVRTRYSDDDLREYARAALHWTGVFGFRPAGMVGQSIHETNYLRFTGDARFGDHNFAGIGVTGGGVTGEVFASIDAGWLAFCCHMALYVWGAPSLWPLHLQQYGPFAVRLASVRWADEHTDLPDGTPLGFLGVVRVWRDLVNGRWAHTQALPVGTLANGYASSCIAKTNILLSLPRGEDPALSINIRGLEDVRNLMARNPQGGNAGRRALSAIRGAVIHFNGPDVPDPSVRSDRSFVIDIIGPYHAQKDFGGGSIGDGVMYHVAVLRDGTRLQLRDFEQGLWHCGNTPWNKASIAIYVHIGINQHATAAQLQSVREVVDDIRAFTGEGREMLKGHMELSSTNCPGTLMADLVRPYRAVSDAPIVIPPDVVDVMLGAQLDPWRFDEAAQNYATAFNGGQDFWVLSPFVDWLLARGGLMTMGYVVSGAFNDPDTGILTQYFEGGALEWHPTFPPESRVLRRHTGLEVLRTRFPERVGQAA